MAGREGKRRGGMKKKEVELIFPSSPDGQPPEYPRSPDIQNFPMEGTGGRLGEGEPSEREVGWRREGGRDRRVGVEIVGRDDFRETEQDGFLGILGA